jgi:hypothetical protein
METASPAWRDRFARVSTAVLQEEPILLFRQLDPAVQGAEETPDQETVAVRLMVENVLLRSLARSTTHAVARQDENLMVVPLVVAASRLQYRSFIGTMITIILNGASY